MCVSVYIRSCEGLYSPASLYCDEGEAKKKRVFCIPHRFHLFLFRSLLKKGCQEGSGPARAIRGDDDVKLAHLTQCTGKRVGTA